MTMDAHEWDHEIAKVNHHVKEAIKKLAPFYTDNIGCQVHFELLEATAVLDRLDNIIFHRLLNKGG